MKNPCGRDCPEREPGCHGSCEKYQAWKAWNQEQAEKKKAYLKDDAQEFRYESTVKKRQNWNRFKKKR